MLQYRMISSKLSRCCILLLLCGCHLGHYSNYKSVSSSAKNHTDTKVFLQEFDKVLYKFHLKALNKTFGGLLLLKKTSNESYRVILASELGMTYVDMELNDTGFYVHKILPELNKYGLLDLVKKDLALLLQHRVSGKFAEELYSTKSEIRVLHYKGVEKSQNYYFINSSSAQIDRIEHAVKKKIKIEIMLSDREAGAPRDISIKHNGKGVKIELNRLEQ